MSIVSQKSLKLFRRRLLRWYETHGRRDLPWRNTDDAYAIYISETMLQQTQVATVLARFYFPFLKRFPTLSALAKAELHDVLSLWQGLGYYQRARNLHAAARQSKGSLPDTVEELTNLPGIGKNTAHAVAAFAFKQPVAVMEANVKRVICRIFALKTPKTEELWEKAAFLLDKRNPFDYNQAMMDIGATVCTRRNPTCGECPANAICAGKTNPEAYPAKTAKKATPVRRKDIILLRNKEGKYFATPRTSRFLHGLYHFIETEPGSKHIPFQQRELALARAKTLGSIRQQYSHFTLEADVKLLNVDHTGNSWYSASELSRLPVSMAESKIIRLIG